VGKWALRLAEKTASPPGDGTDKTDKRGLLSVLAVTPEGGTRVFHAPPTMSDDSTAKPEPCVPATTAPADDSKSAFLDRRARLLRWGWKEADAEALAHRLTYRDHDDDRVSCTDCRHYRPARCGNHRRAGLSVAEVGRDLAMMLQRCQGFLQVNQSEAQQ